MPTQVQFRRGTTAQNNNFTGAAGELSVNTSNNSIRVHDGSTAGGFELANMNRSLRQFASTTSTELRSVLSDETGTGNAVFSLSPTIQSPTVETSIVAGNTTFDLVNTTATTVNFAGAATTLEIGAATGLTNINNNLEVDGDIQIDGGDLTFNTSRANIANSTATTVSFAGAATSLSIGAGSGTTTVNNNLTVASNSLANSGVVTTAFTAGTLQTAGNLNAAAALVAGNFNATGNINGVDGRFSTAVTAATLQASGNVNAAAGRIAGNFSTTGVLRVTNTAAATGENTGAAIISGGASVSGNLYVGGNLYVAGTTTTLNSNVLVLEDPIIFLADNSTSDVLDLGLVGTFNNGTQQHGGFVRDASDGVWKIFSGVVSEPNVNGTVDFTSATYDPLRIGALTATSGTFSSTISATSSNVNTSGALFTGSATAGTFQTSGNVNGNNLRVATNSSLGTVVQGTWNATPIALNYLAASTISGVSLGNNLNTLTMNTSGTGLSGSTTYNGSGAATFTVTSNATSANTASAIVARDGSGNFSAGTITATLSGTATGLAGTPNITVGTINSGSITSTSASGVLHRAAANQDGIEIRGRAGGTGGWEAILTPTTLSADRTFTFPDVSGTVVTTGDTGTVTSTMIADGTIVNGDISASAAIAVSKLAASTISGVTLGNNLNTLTMGTSGTGLSGSTTYNGSGAATFTVTSNATNANTGSTIVARDASGNFSAGTITATLSGTATQVSNSLTLAVSGTGLSGSATFNGSSAQTFTVTSNATSANTGGAIVARDGSGNFNAGTITATLSGTATTSNNSTITDDTTTNATHYPNFVAGTSGAQAEKVSSTKLTFNPSSGLLTSTDYNSSSDKRLKKEIKTIEGALDTVNKLRGVTFTWKEGGSKAVGLIAQEVQKVLPDVVTKDDHGFLGIRYTNLIGVLVEAIKEQQDQINDLKKQIEKLNG